MTVYDNIVVGSGCAGSMAAQTLIEANMKVLMIDVGAVQQRKDYVIPNDHFLDNRQNDEAQYKYFLGQDLEGLSWGRVGKGAQVTPPRKHITDKVEEYIPLESNNFSPLESLGYGGLGIGWGLQCFRYSDAELNQIGLDKLKMESAYRSVARRIGISAEKDNAADYTLGNMDEFQPAIKTDKVIAKIIKNYQRKRGYYLKQGFYMGRPPLALLTKDMGSRKAYEYKDMDYYSNFDESSWRPEVTVNRLKLAKNFSYRGNLLVISFRELNSYTEVTCLSTINNEKTVIRCKKLILCCGALGSARIILRSLGNSNTKLPVLCNPYTYVPSLQPTSLGSANDPYKSGFAQLALFLDEDGKNTEAALGSFYSYQSLMQFRIIQQIPLDFVNARRLMQYVLPAMCIVGIHHPDKSSDKKYIELTDSRSSVTGDKLKANYGLSDMQIEQISSREKKYMKTLRRLGVFPLAKVRTEAGASIHYAGTLPFSNRKKEFSLAPNGLLHGSRSIYVADSSGFKFLPAKGLTFTLMSNAHNVAKGIIKS